jgi:hypothetical protein
MDLHLDFVDLNEASVGDSAVHLVERDGRYPLPRVVLIARPAAWIEEVTVSCALDPPDEELRHALLTEWENSGPAGHGTRLLSAQRWLPAELVRRPTEARLRWAVTCYGNGPYERFVNSVEPLTREASITVTFEPVTETPPDAAEPVTEQDPRPVHLGHVAVDFGTSNCTATLFDQKFLPPRQPLSREQVGQLRKEVLDLLDRGPAADAQTRAEFFEFVADIASALLPDASGTDSDLRDQLRKALAIDSQRGTRLLYALLLELERSLTQCSDELRPQLAAALNGAYSRSWHEPPLDRLRLFGVQLDEAGTVIIESKATVTSLDPLRAEVGSNNFGVDDDEGDKDGLIYAGLKQRLGSTWPQPELGPGRTSDDLIRESLRDIIGRCDRFIATSSSEIGKGRVDKVVITFPTMASPKVRQKLRDIVGQLGISLVDASFDEAIAAAMFTMLRDFGGDHDIGLELLRSQSRPAGTGRWTQNLLIIDIGGGTTDIALLGLHLSDQTPGDLDPARHGRYYELLPEVLGSTGRLQLGGELTSLRVFYWIKAALADRLLLALPESFEHSGDQLRQLEHREGGERRDDPFVSRIWEKLPSTGDGGADEFDVLDGIVPTRSRAGDGRLTQAFWLLWTMADEIKRQFYAPDAPAEIVLGAEDARQVLRAVQAVGWPAEVSPPPDVQAIPDEALTIALSRKKFVELVTDDLEEIMKLAYFLALERLDGAGRDAPDPIDRIILTGQASRAPLVKECLLRVFDRPAAGQRSVRWQPSTVVVEGDYAKLATSLGACWAKSNQGFAPGPEGARPRLTQGRNEFRIRVDNLFFNLPCTFLLGTTLGGPADGYEILPIGAELYQGYPDQDVAVIRSPDFELVGDVAVYRQVYRGGQAAPGGSPHWGDFQWETLNKDHDLKLNFSIWPRQISARLEATSNLDLFLLLSRGRAHYRVDGPSTSVLPAAAAAGPPAGGGPGEPAAGWEPGRIVVNAYSTDGDHEGEAIFTAGRPDQLAGDPAAAPFPETFHVPGPDGAEQAVRGAISSPLPDPPGNGSWTFHYLDGQEGKQQIGMLPPPSRVGQLQIRYFASVDERGDLRVHAGEVPYWPAESLVDVQERSGSVLRTPMLSTGKDYDASRDPFSGRH